MARNTVRSGTKTQPDILVEWALAELPSSQHRAGLAGLALMVRWLDRQPRQKPGVCEIHRLDARGLALRLDLRGLEELFDEVYGATQEEIPFNSLRKKKSGRTDQPIRTEQREVRDKKGKVQTKQVYIYPQVVPRGAFLLDLDPTREGSSGLWVKLWRDMVWGILRGIPAQRRPFEARAEKASSGEAAEAWASLTDPENPVVGLPSTYYLGAQATTAELVPFADRARTQFLLHFAAYVMQVYVPVVLDAEGKREYVGYAVAVPDVADLATFCDAYGPCLRARASEPAGYRPRGAVIDLAVESGLDFLGRLRERVAAREGTGEAADLVLGMDVFHLQKEGNNVRLRGAVRVEPEAAMIDQYERIRKQYWDPVFRRTRLLNLVDGRPWHAGFDRVAVTQPVSRTMQSSSFQHDAREAFKSEETEVNR